MVWHPSKYAELLARKIEEHGTHVWLLNTGWTGGSYGVGRRMSLSATRAIVDAIHNGSLAEAPSVEDPNFGFQVPTACEGVPSEILQPRETWDDPQAYDATALKLAKLFHDNFERYAGQSSSAIAAAGPIIGK